MDDKEIVYLSEQELEERAKILFALENIQKTKQPGEDAELDKIIGDLKGKVYIKTNDNPCSER